MNKAYVNRLEKENKLLSEKINILESELEKREGTSDLQGQIDESHFKSIFENSTIGLYKTTPDGEILMVNPAAVRMLGYESYEELRKRNLEMEGFQPEYSRDVFKSILEKRGMVRGLESAWHRKDGSRIYVRESAKAIRNEKGDILYYIGTFEDVTDKKVAERKLKESESKYRALFEYAPVPIWEQDYAEIKAEIDIHKKKYSDRPPEDFLENDDLIDKLKGKLKSLDVNQEGVRMYGAASKKELLGSVGRIRSEATINIFKKAIYCIAEGGTHFVDEDLNYDLSGNKINTIVKWQVAPGQEDDYRRVYVTSMDISRIKEVEQKLLREKEKAEQADNMKSAFLANMSHEIRTPMNSIIGFSELLLEKAYDEKEKESFVNLIVQNGKNLLNLINDIIDLSKIEAGYLQIEYEKCDVRNVLVVLVENFKRQIKSMRNNVEIRLSERFENHFIVTDSFRLNQILSNLIGNAVKFTKEGFVEVGCNLTDDNRNIEFYVKDTGLGISEDNLQTIFQRFERIQTDSLKDADGTGLGLYITNQLVRLLGGEIRAESKEGVGSVFRFTIPYHPAPGKKTDKKTSLEVEAYDFEGKTFLIAEDNEANYYFLENLLASFNASRLWAKNGKEAVEQCMKNDLIDVVLMDIKMPEMDGYEAVKLIKKNKPSMPVIAETAFAVVGEDKKCYNAGFDDYVSKPIDSRSLLTKIRQLIEE
ncbi:MAG: PAS domain S-box protein [Bacteroidales bacterium]|nr:PAS domain S-box protein [Bacteroidales bacterium]MCF8344115.1 PAS domain S-box protein [Bacteroidales bacterium]MCF8352226.1 PAS domain S-box protein [Bacteroidales bacterium]MCF8375712.1 PAS domain S-box protein [Bacteroidales bacterium]MCF8400312.1 PAS domain S-box protein [Bacteroidales bacterium]